LATKALLQRGRRSWTGSAERGGSLNSCEFSYSYDPQPLCPLPAEIRGRGRLPMSQKTFSGVLLEMFDRDPYEFLGMFLIIMTGICLALIVTC
jgi:hypothetical protein